MIIDRDPGDENDAPRALPMRDARARCGRRADAVDREWDRAFPRASEALEARVAWAMDFLDGKPSPLMRDRLGSLLDHQRQHHQGR